MDVALIFRSRINLRYSIETLFDPLTEISGVNTYILPKNLDSIINVLHLFFYSLKIKEKIVHISGDVNYMALFLFWKKIIITVHDLNHYEDLIGFRKWLYGLIWFRLPLSFAEKIVVISPYTKQQLQKNFTIDIKKIKIIPNTFQQFDTTPSLKEILLKNKLNGHEDNYTILCIGGGINKNITRLIAAIENISNIQLRLVGNYPKEIFNILEKTKIPYNLSKNITRAELSKEYKKSDILYFASTKEGFGLPILEAQSMGLIVITSTTTAMPYVAGEGALLVNPYSIEEIRNSILKIKSGNIDKITLLNKGYENLKRFTIEKFIESYVNEYRN